MADQSKGPRGRGTLAVARGLLVAALGGVVVISVAFLTGGLRWWAVLGALAALTAYLSMPRLARAYIGARRPRWMPMSAVPLALADVAAWAGGLMIASSVAKDSFGGTPEPRHAVQVWGLLFVSQAFSGLLVGTYRGRWRVGSFGEVGGVAAGAALAWLATYGVLAAILEPLDRRTFVITGLAGMVLMAVPRGVWRIHRDRRPSTSSAERIIVFGAGRGAAAIMPALVDPESPYLPVALLDDDPAKRFRTVNGVRVVGTRADIEQVVAKFEATGALIAIPSATSEVIRALVAEFERVGVRVRVLPRPGDLVGGLGVGDIRDVSEADLLGRRMNEIDLDAIAHYVSGKRVLVTGAGGSIGSELSRQLWRFGPSELMLLDRDESALHGTLLSITGKADLGGDMIVLCDIRDRPALGHVFGTRRPEVVFHAAALKHVPILENYPHEAYKTNVLGTRNVLACSVEFGVERVINISTDKAADPVNILGLSKRITERLTATYARTSGRPFVSVRFGNVLGSRGSMLVTFREQVERGGPITVTHPEATRYFMMIEEAVQLTIQAGAIGRPGDVLVLDMGEPVRIMDVAQLLASRSARPIRIEQVGLRPGEKLHEVLFSEHDQHEPSTHPAISRAVVPVLDEAALRRVLEMVLDDDSARDALAEFAAGPGSAQGSVSDCSELNSSARSPLEPRSTAITSAATR